MAEKIAEFLGTVYVLKDGIKIKKAKKGKKGQWITITRQEQKPSKRRR